MRFHKNAAQLAVVMALSLVTPMISHADPKAQPVENLPNLMVDSSNQGSETVLTIRNTGGAPSAACHVRVQFSTGAVFYARLFEIQPGAVVMVQAPAARDGKPFTITVEVDCDHEVIESDETDNIATLRYLS
jgi:hypothetical protein